MVDVDPDWWKTVFDETYLITDARSVCDTELTRQEVSFLEEALTLEKSWPILDLCGGQGRHCLELSRRGFGSLTVFDYSKVLIDLGREMARKQASDILFVCGDARNTGLASHRFKAIIVMASSFGYFLQDGENKSILREAFRSLMSEGSLLLDLPDRDFVLKNLAPQSWHKANEEIVVCRQRRLDGDVIYCQELVLSKIKGLIRDATYCTQLYSSERIEGMLRSAGFSSVAIQPAFAFHNGRGDLGIMTNRMVVIARKH